MFGWGYVINHCISLFKYRQKEEAIKIYYGECLRLISENTARISQGEYMTSKLDDVLNPKPIDTRTPEEIIDGIRKKVENMSL